MFRERARWYIEHKLGAKNYLYYLPSGGRPGLISLVEKSRFQRILARMLDESEFLSPYGLRSLSRYHQEHPLVLDFDGRTSRLDYEPGESHSGLFGGNSNWRGPVWFPLNFLAIELLRHLHNFFGDDLTVELPTGSGKKANLHEVAAELERRLLSLFLLDANGRRPAHGANPRFQNDPTWRDSLLFYEYFHGETGEGLGASHQTGWTALAGALVANRRVRARRPTANLNFTDVKLRRRQHSPRVERFVPVPSSSHDGRRFWPAFEFGDCRAGGRGLLIAPVPTIREQGAFNERARTSNRNRRQQDRRASGRHRK